MGRKKKLENIVKELVEIGYEKVQLGGMEENVVRTIYDQVKNDVDKAVENIVEKVEEETFSDVVDQEQEVMEDVLSEDQENEISDVIDALDEGNDVGEPEVEEEIEVLDPKEFSTHEQILSLFSDEEKDGEYLKVNGLRRVARLVIGPIVDQDVELLPFGIGDESSGTYSGISSIMSITFSCWNPAFGIGELRFSDAADCIPNYNAEPEYGRYVSAMATTRAEARVLRKALGLNAVSSEEMTDLQPISVAPQVDGGKISSPQIAVIEMLTKTKGIEDIDAIIKEEGIEREMKDLSKDEAIKIISILNKKKGPK